MTDQATQSPTTETPSPKLATQAQIEELRSEIVSLKATLETMLSEGGSFLHSRVSAIEEWLATFASSLPLHMGKFEAAKPEAGKLEVQTVEAPQGAVK